MVAVEYEIPGKPIPLKRHRNIGKVCYDPQKKEKNLIRAYARMFLSPVLSPSVALKLTLEYHMPIPKSYSKAEATKALNGPHSKKPDLSNLIKFTEDVFNEMIWKDDSLIAEIHATKFYSHEPKTVFKIEVVSKEIFKKAADEITIDKDKKAGKPTNINKLRDTMDDEYKAFIDKTDEVFLNFELRGNNGEY